MTDTEGEFHPVPGIRLAAVPAGIRYRERNDLVLMALPEGANAAAVFTRNAFCAAPVTLARENLASGSPRFLLINSGNANAGTGKQGMTDARACCAALARVAGCADRQVLPFSTGVIGEPLPVPRIERALPALLEGLSEANWPLAARAIMTTDTVPKLVSRRFEVAGRDAVVTGIAKGAGMIRPDMATMLAYLATDLAVEPGLLQQILEQAVQPSFNSITVDGDTSTNDACVLVAAGSSALPPVASRDSEAGRALAGAVADVCMELATALVRDAEGATKLVRVEVGEAVDEDEARRVAYTIAHSPLVKTALFASDPNWGRILAAVGRAGLPGLDIDRVRIFLDDVCIVRDGGRSPDYTEQAGHGVVQRSEFSVGVALGRGAAAARVLTCDLSYDYVKINAEYRT
jgi:glutamate N-acetyltransferase/amino-acid N-acetyltransferase